MARKIVSVGARVVWPAGSWQRRAARSLCVVIIACAALVYVRTVLAVHDTGLFQLDGDAATGTFTVPTTPTPAADDWDKVCYQVATRPVAQGGLGLTPAQATAKCGIGSPTSGATATSWVEEPNPASTIFTGGGSKDPHDISDWLWKNEQNNPPDKDNLVHAYAVRYSVPSSPECPSGSPTLNCDVIYFGSDRFDNSGDATQGFWFLQNRVSLTNTKSQGGFLFSGVHRAGNLLVISDFSNGGTTSTITVYSWDPTCLADNNPVDPCDDANLKLLANLTGARGPLPHRRTRRPRLRSREPDYHHHAVDVPGQERHARERSIEWRVLRGRHQPLAARTCGGMLRHHRGGNTGVDLDGLDAEGFRRRNLRQLREPAGDDSAARH